VQNYPGGKKMSKGVKKSCFMSEGVRKIPVFSQVVEKNPNFVQGGNEDFSPPSAFYFIFDYHRSIVDEQGLNQVHQYNGVLLWIFMITDILFPSCIHTSSPQSCHILM